MSRPKLLVITPVRHIAGLSESLEAHFEVVYLDDPDPTQVVEIISRFDAIFTNPNKSKVYIGVDVLSMAKSLKAICTASTGTNHIDKEFASKRQIKILSLTEERDVIEKISSTAELAFALTLAALRNVVHAHHSVIIDGEWNYTRFIGRQMNALTVGVIGYGRLGSLYAGYCLAFGAKVLIYDPYKTVQNAQYEQVENLLDMLKRVDILSIHAHVTDETFQMINYDNLKIMKDNVIIVNTSRGEIVNEDDVVDFLVKNPCAKVAVDVLRDEIRDRTNSPLLTYGSSSTQVLITPHIGGMTREAQEIAFLHSANMLIHHFEQYKND